MKKILLIAITLLGLTSYTKAQSFDPILAGKLKNTIDSMRTVLKVKGISACVIYPGMGTWKGVSGISHAGSPITPDMEFGIASNTKLFTGVLILKLAENNLLHLDDSLYQYLPAFKNIDTNITIRQLLNHTSGLADVIKVPGYSDSILTNPNRIFTPGELMTWAGTPSFAPGTGWEYCNTNYLLAGIIAESVTGKSYGQLLHDSILTPLKLDSTFLDVYDSVLYAVAHPWQAGVDNTSIPRKALNSAAWAAGAMYSTSGEMTQWYQALMNGKVINANLLKEMTTFVGTGNYGIGISKTLVNGRTVWTHGGAIWGGYNSSMMYDTATGIIICVLINQFPTQAYQVSIQLLSNILNSSVGFSENKPEVGHLAVYPNPSRENLIITTPESEIEYTLINAQGMAVHSGITDCIINLKNLAEGMYFLRVRSNNSYRTFKIIKE